MPPTCDPTQHHTNGITPPTHSPTHPPVGGAAVAGAAVGGEAGNGEGECRVADAVVEAVYEIGGGVAGVASRGADPHAHQKKAGSSRAVEAGRHCGGLCERSLGREGGGGAVRLADSLPVLLCLHSFIFLTAAYFIIVTTS